MIKKLNKILIIIFSMLVLTVVYLSILGIKTDKFNDQISNNILKISKKIKLNLNDVNYLLDPLNFTINIKTKNPKILLEGKSLEIEGIKTNISLKSLINKEFSLSELKIKTKEIKIKDVIKLSRVLQNSPQLFVLDTIIKDGFVSANIYLKFDKNGKIKENFEIKGSTKEARLNILNQYDLKNINFDFSINNEFYLFKNIDLQFDNLKIISPLIKVKKNKNFFFVNGKFSNMKKNFRIEEFNPIFNHSFKDIDFQKIEFSSNNDFSFNINKNFKFNNFKIESIIDLDELIIDKKNFKLKNYFSKFDKEIKLTKHKVIINYNKNKLDIIGNGNILLEENSDDVSYQVLKNKDNLSFDIKLNIKNNSFKIDFLEYEKKEGLKSSILLKGNLKKNNQLTLDLIELKEKKNQILIEGLDLNKNFKILDIENFKINYRNNKKILNKLKLIKDNSNFIIEGESLDAESMINNILNNNEESSSIFENLNSKINIIIEKTYIDNINYINNLNGNINFDNNKISDLKLESIFPNQKKINLSIKTNDNLETVTRLFSAYPKPLIKRYDFIKGFEEGDLDFYSSKKNGISNSLLIIDNFKVKEVPIFAKLLSLASLQGIADLLTGEGIRFTDFEMNFSNQKGVTKIEEMYAIGPAVSILMDGYIDSKKLISLRGTLVPATTINRSISSIPLLGKILIGDKTGEGVFGVSFKIKGPPKDLKTTVNPIKTLTPRFITRTLEKIKNN